MEPDGTVVITNNPQDMAGYTWVRRFRVERSPNPYSPYTAKLAEQTFTPGPCPETAADVLTAAFIAAWRTWSDMSLTRRCAAPCRRPPARPAGRDAQVQVTLPVLTAEVGNHRQQPLLIPQDCLRHLDAGGAGGAVGAACLQ